MLIDVEAEASFLDVFKNVDETGDTNALRAASLGTLFGLETFADQLVPLHTSGTMGGTPLTNGVIAAGIALLDIDGTTGTNTLVKGDIITIDTVVDVNGNLIPFVVTADIAAVAGAFTGIGISPPAPSGGIGDGLAVTLIATHTPNLVFHKDAFNLTMRTLANEESENSTISSQADPISGIPLRLETWRDPKFATRYWRFDVLYGVKTLRPELGVRMLG